MINFSTQVNFGPISSNRIQPKEDLILKAVSSTRYIKRIKLIRSILLYNFGLDLFEVQLSFPMLKLHAEKLSKKPVCES